MVAPVRSVRSIQFTVTAPVQGKSPQKGKFRVLAKILGYFLGKYPLELLVTTQNMCGNSKQSESRQKTQFSFKIFTRRYIQAHFYIEKIALLILNPQKEKNAHQMLSNVQAMVRYDRFYPGGMVEKCSSVQNFGKFFSKVFLESESKIRGKSGRPRSTW